MGRQKINYEIEYARLQGSAQAAVRYAIATGRLPKPTTLRCVDCGCQATEYDHRNYRKKLDVEPVCRPHNIKRGSAEPLWLRKRMKVAIRRAADKWWKLLGDKGLAVAQEWWHSR